MTKMTEKQLAKWVSSIPETANVWQLTSADDITLQQANAADLKYGNERRAVMKLSEDLRNLDSFLTANAESDASENMPSELNDAGKFGYWKYYFNHLVNAAAVHWEGAGRDLNAELGRIVY
jgi:hypothetical protein